MAKNTIPAKPTPPTPKPVEHEIDMSVLTDAKKAELDEKARVKMQARLIADAEDEYLRRQMQTLERAAYPEPQFEMKEITVDLAPYADRITLDGRPYFHGQTYTVSRPVYDVLVECTQRTWDHDEEIHGDADKTFYQRLRASSQETRVSMKTGAVVTRPVSF